MTTIADCLTHRARIHPEMLAIEDDHHQITYAEYDLFTNQLAHYLKDLGVQHGDRVAVLSRNHSTMLLVMFACAKIGAIMVPLNSRLAANELSWIVQNCEAKVLFYEDLFECLVTNELQTFLQHLIRFSAARTVQSFLHTFSEQPLETKTSEEDPVIMIYTSGTTGKPKGVVIAHENLTFVCQNFAVELDVRQYDRFLLPTPLFHISGVMFSLLSIMRGMTMILLPTFHPVDIWNFIDNKRINVMMAVPTMLKIMLQTLKGREHIIESLRNIYCGGAQFPAKAIQEYADFGYSIHQVYALTETSCYLTHWWDHLGMEHSHSLGKPSYLVDVEIRHPDTGEVLPTGEPGEIVTRGKHIFQGYWNNIEETDKVLKDGWFFTRDVGYLDEHGFLHILDRIKDMIACGGEKVYPAQVEAVVQELDQVLEVAVIGVKDPIWVEIPRAYVVLKQDQSITEEEILEYVHSKISSYKLQQVHFIDELPKNGMGKVVKFKLKEQAHQELAALNEASI
ncbi:class I adenylate-forming enzyme family protein [Hazenella coriacea]|uniref:Acyl-CoA synthetase (AMP-forming)/AMP-acid ligase II n=1 Tax=Hazenella coriacea TaxID=1179467 RepID=A0A4R3L4Y7_9BACL|nr:AMP-binding protein [Hazenella coriacea]TCS93840.1 acyl-CoA synthetase (AMP-forming)/AMP-acid ligase II [Hazenella coriacea]